MILKAGNLIESDITDVNETAQPSSYVAAEAVENPDEETDDNYSGISAALDKAKEDLTLRKCQKKDATVAFIDIVIYVLALQVLFVIYCIMIILK